MTGSKQINDRYILGAHFMKHYFTVFDQGSAKIGFAKRLNDEEIIRKS